MQSGSSNDEVMKRDHLNDFILNAPQITLLDPLDYSQLKSESRMFREDISETSTQQTAFKRLNVIKI